MPNEDGTYTVNDKTDTLWGLAEKVYGDGNRWKEFSRVGGDDVDPHALQEGMVYASPDSGRGMERPPNMPSSSTPVPSEGNFASWWDKPIGAPLTDDEAKIQMAFGVGEMTIGLAGVFSSPASFYPGLYVLADGGLLLADGKNGIKAQPGFLLANLENPVQELPNGVPFAVPLP